MDRASLCLTVPHHYLRHVSKYPLLVNTQYICCVEYPFSISNNGASPLFEIEKGN
jgi:hypothetical protein